MGNRMFKIHEIKRCRRTTGKKMKNQEPIKGKIIELPTRQSRITQLRQREALLEMRISDKCREEIDELMLIDEELEELQNDNNNSQI